MKQKVKCRDETPDPPGSLVKHLCKIRIAHETLEEVNIIKDNYNAIPSDIVKNVCSRLYERGKPKKKSPPKITLDEIIQMG